MYFMPVKLKDTSTSVLLLPFTFCLFHHTSWLEALEKCHQLHRYPGMQRIICIFWIHILRKSFDW